MDIRSFFAKKKDTPNKKKPTPSSNTSSRASSSSSSRNPPTRSSPSSSATNTTSKKRRQPPASSPHFNKSKQREEITIEDSDDDSDATTDNEVTVSPPPSKKGRKENNGKTQILPKKKEEEEEDSDATTDGGGGEIEISPAKKKTARSAPTKKTATAAASRKQTKKLPKNDLDDLDSDATTDNDEVTTPPPKKSKTTTKKQDLHKKLKEEEYDSDATTDDNDDEHKRTSKYFSKTSKKTTKEEEQKTIQKEERVEMSASDFFNTDSSKGVTKRSKTKPVSPSKNKKDSDFLSSSSSDNDDVDTTTRTKKIKHAPQPPKKIKKYEEDDDFLSSSDNDKKDNDDDDDDYVQNDTKEEDDDEDDDDFDNDDFETSPLKKSPPSRSRRTTTRKRSTPSPPPPSTSPVKKESPVKRKPSSPPPPPTPSSTTKKRKTTTAATKPSRLVPLKPTTSLPSSYTPRNPTCLSNYTFVLTGVLPTLSREDAIDYIKILGGRVTSAVSSRTHYLLAGDELEDGRQMEEGSKFRKAMEINEGKKGEVVILRGEGELYGVTKLLDDAATGEDVKKEEEEKIATPAKKQITNPYAKKTVTNPYAKKTTVSNPYASSSTTNTNTTTSNPYAKTKMTTPSPSKKSIGGGRANVNDVNALWADKYAPSCTREILGNQDAVRKLTVWLAKWEDTFNSPNNTKKSSSYGSPNGPRKAALLSGPPGIGKTTTALLVAQESKRDVLELNASDTRSKKGLTEGLGDVTGSKVLNFGGGGKMKRKETQKRCIIMDEVDGMGAGDRSGISSLITMIKSSKVPIICICNDRQSQKIKSLVPYCLDLRYRRPVKSIIAKRAVEIGMMEGMNVELNAAETIAESCGNDIRQVVNCLQMWSNKKTRTSSGIGADMTYKAVKENKHFINKDEILRVSMFDATRLIVEGPRGLSGATDKAVKDSLYKRTDAYFVDYSLMGLNVHQNYLKVLTPQFSETKRKGDVEAELDCLERMYEGTKAMSDFGIVENTVRGGDQLWELLPLCSVLAVKAGYHVSGENGGFLSGYPEFAGWLGKNSSKNRKLRLLQELSHHMNYKVSAGVGELRLGYVPALRKHLLELMMNKDGARTSEVIELMDEYGLDRDDLFENIDEFNLDPKGMKFADLDSKAKAAFTREYNKGVHKSQALVAEQGVGKTRKKAAGENVKNAEDLDAVNDDVKEEEEEEESEEMDAEAIQALFQKKKAKKTAAAATGKKGAAAKGKGRKKK